MPHAICATTRNFGNRRPQEVTLGDGHVLEATGEGTVPLDMLLPDGNAKRCNLLNVLFVPKLSYSLLSVTKVSETGKTTRFNNSGCEILNGDHKVIAFATRVGNHNIAGDLNKSIQLRRRNYGIADTGTATFES